MYSVGALDVWGWLPQPRLASNVWDLYNSVQKTMSPMSKWSFLFTFKHFYSKSNKKQLVVYNGLAKA